MANESKAAQQSRRSVYHCNVGEGAANLLSDQDRALSTLRAMLKSAPLYEDWKQHEPVALVLFKLPKTNGDVTIWRTGPDSWHVLAETAPVPLGKQTLFEMNCTSIDCIVGALREHGLAIRAMEFFKEGTDFDEDLAEEYCESRGQLSLAPRALPAYW